MAIINEKRPTDLKTSDFYYDLPERLIAQHPMEKRDTSRLMVIDRESGSVEHKHFYDIIDYLREGDVLVINDSKVIPARLYGHAEGREEALLELLLLRQHDLDEWECLVKPGKRAKIGSKAVFGNGILHGEVTDIVEEGNRIIRFDYDRTKFSNIYEVLQEVGMMPLPPYITERLEDKERYQTVYSKELGSAAAPTAGLHFTDELMERIRKKGVKIGYVTLHVGLGTFRPVKADIMAQHEMHTEYISVSRRTIEALLAHDCKAVAVGTTSVRTIESLYYIGASLAINGDKNKSILCVKQWEPYENASDVSPQEALQIILDYMQKNSLTVLNAATQIIITPGYKFHFVKKMITNFHQPKSTLLLLVSAFVEGDWKNIYNYALTHNFRFLSYGDSSLLIP